MTSAENNRLNLLAIRFVALLLALGGGVMLLLAAGLALLPIRAVDSGIAFVLPGSGGQHTLDLRAALLLAGIGGALFGIGLFGALAARRLSARLPRMTAPEHPAPTEGRLAATRASGRTWLILCGGLAFLVVVILARRSGLLAP